MSGRVAPTLENEKNLLVGEVFIDTADEDYILARWCYFNQFSKQFFWNAAQAIEKYLKASLVLNGHTSKGFSHNLEKLFESVASYSNDLIPCELLPPPQVELFKQTPNLWGNTVAKDFVVRVNMHGNPSNRYDYFGIELEAADIFKLDQMIFTLRNLAANLNGIPDASSCIDAGDCGLTYAEIIKKKPDAQLFPFSEKLVHSKRLSTSVHEAARENNFPFSKDYSHSRIDLRIHHTVSRLEMLYSGDHLPFSRQIRVWFEENFVISAPDRQKLGLPPKPNKSNRKCA